MIVGSFLDAVYFTSEFRHVQKNLGTDAYRARALSLRFRKPDTDANTSIRHAFRVAGIDAPKGREPASPLALLAERQPLRLVQAFAAIGDKGVRRSLMQLAEQIAHAVPRRRGQVFEK